MSTTHLAQTTFDILVLIAIIVGLIYEPVIAKWEEKQKEKVIKAWKQRKKYREENKNV